MGKAATGPVSIQGLVVPWWWAAEYPKAPLLFEYTKKGYPVSMGENWTLKQLEATVEHRPHISALKPDTIDQIQVETRETEKQSFTQIVL